jgi:hypothetical protein
MFATAGALLMGIASAESKTKVSMSKRVAIQTRNCEEMGGEIDVSYAYEDGKMVQATTTCNGGGMDGNVCVNTPSTISCYQAPRREMPVSTFVVINDIQVADPNAGGVVVQATPVGGLPTEGIEVSDNSPQGDGDTTVVDAGNVDVPAADPTAGQPASGTVIVGAQVTNPNPATMDDMVVIQYVTPTPAP